MVLRDYNECSWALQCEVYNPEDPCEKPSRRFLRKPVCYIPKKQRLVSRLAEKIAEGLIRFGEAPMGGVLEDSED